LGLSGHEGSVLQTISYDPFGNKTATTGTSNNNFLHFTGREEDPDSGLYYFRARFYDPSVGRFITEDPKGFDAGVNFYAYCKNNPINANDPSGKLTGGELFAWTGIKIAEYGVKGISYLMGNPMTDSQFKEMDESLMGVWKSTTIATPYVAGAAVAAVTGSVRTGAYAKFGTDLLFEALAGDVPDPIPPIEFPLGASYLFEAGKDILFNPSAANAPTLDNINVSKQNSSLYSPPASNLTTTPTLNVQVVDFDMPESNASSAEGGFVLYPNKPNTNMMKSVYSK